MTDCRQLITDYAQTRSEPAFREIVTRYLNLVYSSALRLVDGDEHRAQDVAQIVFADLARKAGELSPDVMLGGWLHRHTCFVAANTLRGERRRLAREREAVEMNSLHEDAGADFARLAPLLDETVNQLDEADRTAILLRFFEQKDFRAVGQSLASGEDAARMRVNRALDKLRDLLAQRGIRTTAGALGIAISANAVLAAPVGLAAAISTAVLTVTAISTSTAITTTKIIAMTTLQKTLITATVAVLAGAGIYEARQAAQLRDQVQTLRQQHTNEIQQLQSERDEALAAASQKTDIPEQYKKDLAELSKLRRQVAAFQKAEQERAQLEKTMTAKLASAKKSLNVEIERANFRLNDIKSANHLRQLGLALKIFRTDHPDESLTNLDQLNLNYAPLSEFAQNEVEYVNTYIPDTGKYPRAILMREKTAHQNNVGKWVRNYFLADGALLKAEVDNNNFTDWERENTQIVEQP